MGLAVGLGPVCNGASHERELEREPELRMLKRHGGNETGLVLGANVDADAGG